MNPSPLDTPTHSGPPHSGPVQPVIPPDVAAGQLGALLETVAERVIFKDLQGRYIRLSQAAIRHLGRLEQELLGKTDFDFFTPEYAGQIQAEERAILAGGPEIGERVERERWLDGRADTWAVKSYLLIKDGAGKPLGWLNRALDISENRQAQEADQRHIQQLAAMAEVSRAVTSSLDLKALLRVLVELVRESFDYYGVNVWLLTEPPEAVQLKAGFGPHGEDFGQAEIQISMEVDNSITQVCRSGEPSLCNGSDEECPSSLGERFPQARSQLVLPLKVAQKNVGALEILSDQPLAFRKEDVPLLRSLADQVTIAIRNATLYQAEQSRRYFAETLYQIARALSSTLKLAEVLGLILYELDRIVPSDQLAVMLLEDEELEFVATHGFPEDLAVERLRVPIRDNIIYGDIFQSQHPISIPDVHMHPDWQQLEELPLARSWMGVPLILRNEVIGILSLARLEPDPYRFSEVTLAQTFAGQAAIALENARLYERLERFNFDLEQKVRERTVELSQAYGQLERLDRTKSDFIRVTSHELRTPLTVILGYSQMLLGNQQMMQDGALSQLVGGIYSGADRMHDIVNRMLDIVKIDNRSLELSAEPIALGLLVRNVAGNFKNALRQRGMTLSIQEGLSELPRVEGDPIALEKVFYQLLTNAIKYTPDGGKIEISGQALAPDQDLPQGGVEIAVRDNGIGIDPASQELIFTKFYQTGEVALHSSSRTKYKGGGPGLGLPIARGIVLAHGGRLWVESLGYDEENYPGSCFFVHLPLKSRALVEASN